MATSPLSISPPGEPLVCKQCGTAIEVSQNFCPVCGTPAQGDNAPDPLVGAVVADRYKIIGLIGRGGMGVVYKCEHTRMGKIMAIKLLHGDLARDHEVQRRFRREAQAASRLSHPNTVSIFDFGTSEGLMYLVMEYVSGEDMGRVLRATRHMPSTRAAAIAAQACGSLAEAHENGIVHRDLKPENLLISQLKDNRDFVKLLDFGLAKLREGEERNEITSAGTLVGTPYYMAPEIIRAQDVDGRADIYALGAVIYRAVTGTPAFAGQSPVAVLTRALTDELVLPSRRRPELGIPEAIDAIVARAMARERGDRYPNIEEMRLALTEYLATEGLSDSLLRDSGLTARQTALGAAAIESKVDSSRKLVVATRNDVEEFERGLRRGRIAGWAGAAFVGVVAVAAGALVYREHRVTSRRPRDAEVEPNGMPVAATLIAPSVDVRGRIGARMTVDHGDVDYYRLQPLPRGTSRLRVELSAQPNIVTQLELLREGRTEPVAIADDVHTGGRQVLAGFRVTGDAQYFLSVHERSVPGAIPMENVTDWYTLRYSITPVSPDTETEPNDNEEISQSVDAPGTYRGWIESHDDVDYWCLASQPGPLRVTLRAPPHFDLDLGVHPRDGTPDRTVDNASGRSETIAPPTGGARPACISVRASADLPSGSPGDGDHQYALEIVAP